MVRLLAFALFARILLAGSAEADSKPGSAADLARSLGEVRLDPGQCYRIRDITIAKEDARIYLTDGYLIFSRPVAGAPIAAIFTAEVDGGDAEVLLMPPLRSERR